MLRVLILIGLVFSTNVFALGTLKATTQFTNFSDSEKLKMQNAIVTLLRTINSERFKKRIINHQVEGENTFVDNNGMTNDEIYKLLLSGSEELLTEKDHEMDLELSMYYSLRSTIGYTYPETLRIWINRRFFRSFRPAQIAANLIHEYMHKLGFSHDYNNTPTRKYSVPYAVGRMVRDLIDANQINLPTNLPRLPDRPIYIPGDFNNPNNSGGYTLPNLSSVPLRNMNEGLSDTIDQHHKTNQQDHYMGQCTDHPND